jgi:hypothetical protein
LETRETGRDRGAYVVELDRERVVRVPWLAVRFFPGQRIENPGMLRLCERYGVPLRRASAAPAQEAAK